MGSTPSPDGALTADYFQNWGGGAAGAVGDVVALRAATDEFSDKRWNSVFAALDGEPVAVRWISNRELEITHARQATVTKAQSSWRDVTIRYVAH